MKKAKLFEIEAAINDARSLTDYKLAYVMYKNMAKIKDELEAIRNAIKPTQEYQIFSEKVQREGIEQECQNCKKIFKLPTPELRLEYLNAIDDRITIIQQYNAQLEEEEIDIEFAKIPFSRIKQMSDKVKSMIDFQILNSLDFMIDFDN